MKIINAMFSKSNGGTEQVFLNYTSVLAQQNCQVIPIIHPHSSIRSHCLSDDLIIIRNYNQYDVFAIRRLRQLIQARQPDCIITHGCRAACLLKKTKTKVPIIAVCHMQSHADFGSDGFIALTESMRLNIIQSGKPEDKVFTVPNMIHIPEHIHYRPLRQNTPPIIGACARLDKIKGIDVFIHALAELKKQAVPFQAKIAGDGKEKETYLRLIQALDLHKEVTLLGWVDDKQSFYEQLDVFCLPSREESFGLVVLESMMHSLPMVLTQLSGPVDIISDSQSAIFVPPQDPIQMAHALAQVIHNKELAQNLSLNAFKRVQHYSNKNQGRVLYQALQTICQNHRLDLRNGEYGLPRLGPWA